MSFKPMLAKACDDPSQITFPVVVQAKLDGVRASVVNGKLVSRTLKPIPNAEIRSALERPEFEGLDGEIVVGEPTAEDCYRRTVSFVMAQDKTSEPWAFYVFDKWDTPGPFVKRYGEAEKIVNATMWADIPLFIVEWVQVHDAAALEDIEGQMVAAGHEGVILRDPAGLYKFGRSGKKGPLLKLKRFSDSEAVVIGHAEELHNGNEATVNALGRTERSSHKANKAGKDTLGKLIVRDLYSGVEFSVGTGFTAQERIELWEQRETLPGKVIKYKFFAVGVKDKPRHPVMLGFRAEADLPSPVEDRDGED